MNYLFFKNKHVFEGFVALEDRKKSELAYVLTALQAKLSEVFARKTLEAKTTDLRKDNRWTHEKTFIQLCWL